MDREGLSFSSIAYNHLPLGWLQKKTLFNIVLWVSKTGWNKRGMCRQPQLWLVLCPGSPQVHLVHSLDIHDWTSNTRQMLSQYHLSSVLTHYGAYLAPGFNAVNPNKLCIGQLSTKWIMKMPFFHEMFFLLSFQCHSLFLRLSDFCVHWIFISPRHTIYPFFI